MWTNIRGYLFFVIYCLILEEFEISTSSQPSNSSLELTEKRQEDKFRVEISRFKHRKAVQDGHLLQFPQREIDNKSSLRKEKTIPLCSNQKSGDTFGNNSKRIRQNITPSQSIQQSEANVTVKWSNHSTSPTPPQSSTTTLNDKDVNITMHCESYWFSCRGRCTQERELGGTEERLQCFCDNSCEIFRDCCADFDQYCSLSGISAQQTKNPDNGLWQCTKNKFLDDVIGVWMISVCPRNWSHDEIKERCSKYASLSYDNHKDTLPVIDRKGITYKNHYCAQCHGVDLKDLVFYSLQFTCDVPAPKANNRQDRLKFLFTFCNLFFWQPPKGATRRYCHYIKQNDYCFDNSLPTEVQQKCINGSLRVVYLKSIIKGFKGANFFNPYCALCSKVKSVVCGPGPFKLPRRITPLAKPFSLVMDLDFPESGAGTETSTVREHKVFCHKGHVYDFYFQVCRPGITPSNFTSLRSQIFSVSVWMRSNISTLWNPLVTEINFKEAIVNNLNINETLISDIVIGNAFGPVSTVVFNININPTVQKNFSIQIFQAAMSSLSIVLNNANFTVFKVTVKAFDCAVIEIFSPHEYTLEGNAVKIRDTGEIFQETDYYSNETEWINGSLVPIGILTVCKPPRLNCSGILVALNENEYVILSNGFLYRNISRELFEPIRFLLINDTIWVCTNFSSNYTEETEFTDGTTKDDTILVVLTYVGLSLSILSFLLVLVTYSLFKELRTLPGINLMNLSLAHLLVDFLYFATGYIRVNIACGLYVALAFVFTSRVKLMYYKLLCMKTDRTTDSGARDGSENTQL
ncbi:hypothetical protein OS493_024881 [Desmophyllum pertusum]|uniref:SMB domain-containing protein n=1 Tax=Desmophyllum pertusum TaxID=174260 RepID=A0A9W9YY63_9CNID|nr:hypothetical protein OS493_024881 [Desmophyllum pertusum]